MSVEIHRRYRKRTNPTNVEREVLNRYAEIYTEARSEGMPRNLSREIVKEAQEALRKVSAREWDDPSNERYEIRQWFNRWNRSRERRRSRGEESWGGEREMTEVEVGSSGGAALEVDVCERCVAFPRRVDAPQEMHDLALAMWEGPWEPQFDDDMIGVYWEDWMVR
jgi:hypothetical protein